MSLTFRLVNIQSDSFLNYSIDSAILFLKISISSEHCFDVMCSCELGCKEKSRTLVNSRRGIRGCDTVQCCGRIPIQKTST